MNRKIATWAALGALILMSGTASAAEKYDIDASHSSVVFRIKHLDVTWFYGRFNDIKGSVTIDKDKPEDGAVSVDIAARSVDTGNKKRDDHLRGPDFFNVKQFPKLSFKSTSVKAAGDGELEVTGDLTCHGVTKPITIRLVRTGEGKSPFGDFRAGWETKFTIQRSEFGITYSPKALSEEVDLIVSIEGVRK